MAGYKHYFLDFAPSPYIFPDATLHVFPHVIPDPDATPHVMLRSDASLGVSLGVHLVVCRSVRKATSSILKHRIPKLCLLPRMRI